MARLSNAELTAFTRDAVYSWCLRSQVVLDRSKESRYFPGREVTDFMCPTALSRLLAADTYPLKLQRLQNKVLRTVGYFPLCTPVRGLHMAFNVPYVYDHVTKLCRQQAEIIKTMRMNMFAAYDRATPYMENIRGFNLAAKLSKSSCLQWHLSFGE
jgi:hypothetical protein